MMSDAEQEIAPEDLLSEEQIKARFESLDQQLAEAVEAQKNAEGDVRKIMGAIQEAHVWASVIRRARQEGVINGRNSE